jgi:dynactin complex subunit
MMPSTNWGFTERWRKLRSKKPFSATTVPLDMCARLGENFRRNQFIQKFQGSAKTINMLREEISADEGT